MSEKILPQSALVQHPHASTRGPRPTAVLLLSLLSVLPGTSSLLAAEATKPASAKTAATNDKVVVLDTVEVTAKADDVLVPPTPDAAAFKLTEVAGGTRFIDNSLVSRGRVGTSSDILAFTPGVFAAPPAGNGDGIKISARGSGVARSAGNFFRNGVLFSFDGLPVTGPGGTPYELFETYGLDYTEVLLGGNAFDFGALQLGGSINYVTKTGYNASPFEGRIDVGSFGYHKYQVSSGKVLGKADYFISATSSRARGYQQNARSESKGFAGNFGYKLSSTASTRFYLRYRTTENETPGNLSLNELNADSSLANPDNLAGAVNRIQPGSTWFGNKTTVIISPDSKVELGLLHHNAPIDIQPNPSPGTAASKTADRERSLWNFRDVTGLVKYTRTDDLGGHRSDTTIAATATYEYDADVNAFAQNPNVTTGVRAFRNKLKTANYDGSAENSLRLGNQFGVTDKFFIDSGLGVVQIRRQSEVTYFAPGLAPALKPAGSTGLTYDRDDAYLTPRFGLRYKLTPTSTLYSNVTRSIEGPNSWQLNRGSAGNVNFHDDIQDQKAIAYEVGGRTTYGAFTGSLSFYYSDVTDELLTVPIDPNNVNLGSRTFNGPDTYKQGIEVGLLATVWSDKGFFTAADKGPANKVTFLQSFTLNDFGYNNESVFPRTDPNSRTAKELPGVPRESYQARLAFEHASGFYLNLSLFYASSYYADFANTLETPAYTLYDAGLGYEDVKRGWKVFVDVRNLTDESYASSAGPAFTTGATAAARANSRQFQAGDGRGIFGGASFKF